MLDFYSLLAVIAYIIVNINFIHIKRYKIMFISIPLLVFYTYLHMFDVSYGVVSQILWSLFNIVNAGLILIISNVLYSNEKGKQNERKLD